MFSNLSLGLQFLYTAVFMFICGYCLPYLGGFNIFALSLAAGSGALVLSNDNFINRLLTNHQIICFFIPLVLLLLLAVLFVCFWIVGLGLGMSTVPDRSSEKTFSLIFGLAGLLLVLLPAYIPFHILGAKGWLLFCAIAAFVIGTVTGIGSLVLVFEHSNGFLQYFLNLVGSIILSAGIFFMIKYSFPTGLISLGVAVLFAMCVMFLGYTGNVKAFLNERALISARLKAKTPADEKTQQFLNGRLCEALEWQSMKKVRQLIKAGADINALSCNKSSLSCALEYGGYNSEWSERKWLKIYEERYKRVKFLLDNGADPNENDVPLKYAMFSSVALQLLLDAGADVNKFDNYGENALLRAAERGNTFAVNILIEHGADINIQNNEGYTPLMKAVFWDQYSVAEILLKNNADTSIKNNEGKTVFDLTQDEKMKTLLKHSGNKTE